MVAVLNRLLGALGRTLITVGTIVLLFAGYQLWGTGVDEANHQEQLTRDLATSLGVDAAPSMSATAVDAAIQRKLEAIDPATAPPMLPPREADVVGTISIPRIGLLDKKFVEGVSKADLRAGPGHYQGTSFPGQAGNSAIAGHRTTYGAPFNRIDELSPGDQIIVSTRQGRFVYEVVASPENTRTGEAGDRWGDAWYTVAPDNAAPIQPTPDNRLTLTACHPKYSAKLRIIVTAKLVAEPAATTPTTAAPEQEAKGTPNTVASDEDLIAGDPDELEPALAWGGAFAGLFLVAATVAGVLRRKTTKAFLPWLVYLVVAAPCAWLLWTCFVHVDRYLPSY